jgi:hypothetical protein
MNRPRALRLRAGRPTSAFIATAGIDLRLRIVYLQMMINNVPTLVSTMMPLSFPEAEPFGM